MYMHPDKGYRAIHKYGHTNLWDIRWPGRLHLLICCYVQHPNVTPLYGPVTWNPTRTRHKFKLHLYLRHWRFLCYHDWHKHCLCIKKLTINAWFIWCKHRNQNWHFCTDPRFWLDSTHRSWFESDFLTQFVSDFLIRFDSHCMCFKKWKSQHPITSIFTPMDSLTD